MTSNFDSDWPVEVCRDRVRRAGETRDEMSRVWNQHMAQHPHRFDLIRGGSDTSWTLVLNTLTSMPVRLSTLFGEWLYLLRAALDGIAYQLAVRDSGENPPPAERSICFPVFDDPAKYDDRNHRGRLKALSDLTFALLRHVQPFNAEPDHRSNVLWWLEELARIDRHRRGHALAPHIDAVGVGLIEPLELTGHHVLPDLAMSIAVEESGPMPILDFEAPADWGLEQIRDHVDISDAATAYLDVAEWAAGVSPVMGALDLGERMARCERFALDSIIDPLATGNITLL
jgi:hypothetical protein